MDLDILYSEYLGVVNSLRLKPTDHVLIASLAQQKINHFLHGKSVKDYLMSSSKRKPSCVEGSLGTPSGLHCVCQKIGEGEKLGTVFEGRVSIGMTFSECSEAKNRKNLITTRILRLKGLEEGINSGGQVDTYSRYVYVHGTNHEERLGKPASSGCLQMGNEDIAELFDLLPEGTHLYVSYP